MAMHSGIDGDMTLRSPRVMFLLLLLLHLLLSISVYGLESDPYLSGNVFDRAPKLIFPQIPAFFGFSLQFVSVFRRLFLQDVPSFGDPINETFAHRFLFLQFITSRHIFSQIHQLLLALFFL